LDWIAGTIGEPTQSATNLWHGRAAKLRKP
jgi:hypothetical protein